MDGLIFFFLANYFFYTCRPLFYSTYDLCYCDTCDTLLIYIFFSLSHKRPFSKIVAHKAHGHNNNNSWLDLVIFDRMVGSLGISDDVITFWDGSIKNKMAATAIKKNNWRGGGIIFSLFFIYTRVFMD